MRWRLCKRFRFEASHVLPDHDGPCRRLHGHSWRGALWVRGSSLQTRGPSQGMLVDFGTLAVILDTIVKTSLDHHHLNDSLAMRVPTSEHVAQWIYTAVDHECRALEGYGSRWRLERLDLDETCTSRCSYAADVD
jgi:6-pyruvoyltetrahydropterin/6-carboxytetrahydropterin synthase